MKRVIVKFFAGPSEVFLSAGRRATSEEEAHFFTGYNRNTDESYVGVHVGRRANGLVRIGFDIIKLDFDLRPETIERMRSQWVLDAASFSKSLLKSASRRSHFSKTFAQLEVSPAHLEGWKEELAAILSNPASYAPIERGPHHD
jgi:hypothetical protein